VYWFLPLLLATSIGLSPVVSGLEQPVEVVASHDGTGRLFIAEQGGRVRIFDGNRLLERPFLDLRTTVSCCANGGLLSIAFHPGYAQNGRFFVWYVNHDENTVLAEYRRSTADPSLADPASAKILMTVAQPKDNVPNHHGGTLQFGPDGKLYLGIGDGGAFVKVTARAQDLTTLLGKLVRLDVDRDPAPELWAWGLRNPWRLSFDRVTGQMFIADVGQDSWEEVNVLFSSEDAHNRNFGWPVMEGQHCYPPGAQCLARDYFVPQLEYARAEGCSITGGFRYRGARWPELTGVYFYGDFCSGRIWGATEDRFGEWTTAELLHSSMEISSFGEDDAGEVYVVDYAGAVYALAPQLPHRRAAGR
jgi:glucose/arabinose dehydrogenase